MEVQPQKAILNLPEKQTTRLQRVCRALLYGLGALVVVLGITVSVLVFGVNTPIGRHIVTSRLPGLTGGMVHIKGLSGRFPTKVALQEISLQDEKGVWLDARQITLRWHPTSLLKGMIDVTSLTGQSLNVLRLPETTTTSAATPPPDGASPDYLRWAIHLGKLDISKISLEAPVLGFASVLSIKGSANLANLADVLNGVDLQHIPQTTLKLNIHRLDQPGQLFADMNSFAKNVDLNASIKDPSNAFLSQIITEPKSVPLDARLQIHGPLNRLVSHLNVSLGGDIIAGDGTANILDKRGDLAFKVELGKTRILDLASWTAMKADIKLSGSLFHPVGRGGALIHGLDAQGVKIKAVQMQFGDGGQQGVPEKLSLQAQVDGLQVAALAGDPFGTTPIALTAAFDPAQPGKPLTLHLSHPLLKIDGDIQTDSTIKGHFHYGIPDLTPWARSAGIDITGKMQGELGLHIDSATSRDVRVSSTVKLDLDDAPPSWGHIVKGRTVIVASASQIQDKGTPVYQLDQLSIKGDHVSLDGKGVLGAEGDQPVTASAHLMLDDLSAVDAHLKGRAELSASLKGLLRNFALRANLKSHLGLNQSSMSDLMLDASFDHLPGVPDGEVKIDGQLDGAPLALLSSLETDEKGIYHFSLDQLKWRGVDGRAKLRMGPDHMFPVGTANISVKDLSQFNALVGQKLGGYLRLNVGTQDAFEGHPQRVSASLDGGLSSPDVRVKSLKIQTTIDNPDSSPYYVANVDADGLDIKTIKGRVVADARGPEDSVHLNVKADLSPLLGGDLKFNSSLAANLPQQRVRFTALVLAMKGDTLRMTKPMSVEWGQRKGAENISLVLSRSHVAPASLTGYAFLTPALSVDLSAQGLKPSFVAPFFPSIDLAGVAALKASLKGRMAKPEGRISLSATGLHMNSGDAASLPPASILGRVDLSGHTSCIDIALNAGHGAHFQISGDVPLSQNAGLAVIGKGHIDLALANAVTGAAGISVRGLVTSDIRAQGSFGHPHIAGVISLNNVAFNDYAQGISLRRINGTVMGADDHLQLQNISGQAGKGTIKLNGQIGVLQAGVPISLNIAANQARVISSELLTAEVNADLLINGRLSDAFNLSGKVNINSATINIPDSVPASVPRLNTVWPKQAATRQQADGADGSGPTVNLRLTVAAPGAIYVRGHGLDAEMMGALRIGGTSTDPNILGNFYMRRGYFNLAGVNLNFTRGVVGFNGSGVDHRLDPSLDFRADRNVQGSVASLVVTGYASAPRIDFTSVPSFPRDQVLAMLLFGSTTPQLTTSQMASVAAALAQIAGGSGGFDPISKIRNLIGLDRLAVGGGSGVDNGGASVEAGKYIMKGVYIGAKQATSGTGTQAQVEIDLTKRLKLNTTVATGGQVTGFTTPENDPGSSIGLSYGLDY